MRWDWVWRHLDLIAELTRQHLFLALTPVAVGLLVALPLGIACARWHWLYPPMLTAATVFYALPSLAAFGIFIAFFQTCPMTVIAPLTLYAMSALLPGVVDGLNSVPAPVRQAATAMGFGPLRRLIQVELPVAVPVLNAGLRVATVSSISLVSVGSLIGQGGLGDLFTRGFQLDFMTPVIVGIVMIMLLALLADLVLVGLQRLLTPWARR